MKLKITCWITSNNTAAAKTSSLENIPLLFYWFYLHEVVGPRSPLIFGLCACVIE